MSRLTSPRIRVASLFAVAALLTLAAAAPANRVQRPVTITISLDSAGAVVVDSMQVHVTPGTRIEWASDLDFGLAVQRHADLFGPTLPPQAMHGQKNRPFRAAVHANAPQGSYKYSVGVWDGANVRVLDPEIIVGKH